MNQKKSKPFGESGIWKWLVLAGFLLIAGCLFSCGASEVSMEVELSGAEASGRSGSEDNENSGNNESDSRILEKSDEKNTADSENMKSEKDTNTENDTEFQKQRAADDETGRQEEATAGRIEEPGDCFVYVCGEVRSPGVYCMKEGQRIFEAVEQAGGFTEQAVREYLNLADQVSDGMKVFVPNSDQVQSGQIFQENFFSGNSGKEYPSGENAGSSALSVKVNLNTASKEELMTLRGIGSARAEDIIHYREENGRFQKIEDIKKVSGIKDAAFEKIKDQITV